jgi:hypothetical protein
MRETLDYNDEVCVYDRRTVVRDPIGVLLSPAAPNAVGLDPRNSHLQLSSFGSVSSCTLTLSEFEFWASTGKGFVSEDGATIFRGNVRRTVESVPGDQLKTIGSSTPRPNTKSQRAGAGVP